MKKVTLGLLAIALFASCNSYNDKMNDLLSEKKKLETKVYWAKDDVQSAENTLNEYFENELKAGNFKVMKTKKYRALSDASLQMMDTLAIYTIKLEDINYSIDSLSKLK
jgi:hypothetical protein